MVKALKSIDLHVDVTNLAEINRARKKLNYYAAKLRRKHQPRKVGQVTRLELFAYVDKIGVTRHTAGGAFKILMRCTVDQAVDNGEVERHDPGYIAMRRQMMESFRPAEIADLDFVPEGLLYPKVSRFLVRFLEAHGYKVPEVIRAHA